MKLSKLSKTFLFLGLILFLFTFSACSKSNNQNYGTKNQNSVSGEVTQDLNDLGAQINQTDQLNNDLASPDMDLDVNF